MIQGLSLAPGAALSLAAGRLVNPRRLKGAALEALGLWALGSLALCLLPELPPLPGRVSRLAGALTALCALTAEILVLLRPAGRGALSSAVRRLCGGRVCRFRKKRRCRRCRGRGWRRWRG